MSLLIFYHSESRHEDVSNTLNVSQYDCSHPNENRMYALNQVAPCKLSPENLYVTVVSVTLYQRSYRVSLNGIMCRMKIFPLSFHCGINSHSSIIHNQNSITYDLILSPEQCALASKNMKLLERNLVTLLHFQLS